MRCNVVDGFFLHTRFVDQADAALRQITQAAVQQPTRATARSKGEIVLLYETDSQSTHRSISGDAGADDSSANHEQIKWLFGDFFEILCARLNFQFLQNFDVFKL